MVVKTGLCQNRVLQDKIVIYLKFKDLRVISNTQRHIQRKFSQNSKLAQNKFI